MHISLEKSEYETLGQTAVPLSATKNPPSPTKHFCAWRYEISDIKWSPMCERQRNYLFIYPIRRLGWAVLGKQRKIKPRGNRSRVADRTTKQPEFCRTTSINNIDQYTAMSPPTCIGITNPECYRYERFHR